MYRKCFYRIFKCEIICCKHAFNFFYMYKKQILYSWNISNSGFNKIYYFRYFGHVICLSVFSNVVVVDWFIGGRGGVTPISQTLIRGMHGTSYSQLIYINVIRFLCKSATSDATMLFFSWMYVNIYMTSCQKKFVRNLLWKAWLILLLF